MQSTQNPAALVAVIGASASGKSSFINEIMGEVAEVGSGNSSCTDKLGKWTYDLSDGRKVTFLDTPGLNFYSEADIDRPAETTLRELEELSLTANVPIQYLFVVHNVAQDPPLSPLKYGSNRRFNSLCSRMQVHVITTHWDQLLEDEDEDPSVHHEIAIEKEESLFSPGSFLEYVRSVSPNAPLHRSGLWNLDMVPVTDHASPKDLIFKLLDVPSTKSGEQMEAQIGAEDPSPSLPDKPTEPVVIGNNRAIFMDGVVHTVRVEPSTRSDEALAVLHELHALSSSMKDHHSFARDHTQHLAEITSTMKNHQSFTSTVQLLSEERDKAKEECSRLLKEVADLQAEKIKMATSFSTSVQVLSEERDKAKAATSRLAEDFAALQDEKENVTRLLATSDAALAQQEKKLEESQVDNRRLAEDLAALQTEKENVARLLGASDAALDHTTRKMNQANAESIRLAEDLEAAEAEKENFARLHARSHAALEEQAKEVVDLTKERDSLNQSVRDLKLTLSATSSEHSACSGKILALQRDLRTSELRSRRSTNSQVYALQEAEAKLTHRTREFEKRVSDLESELKVTNNSVQEQSRELSRVYAEKEALEKKLADQELLSTFSAPRVAENNHWDDFSARKRLWEANRESVQGELESIEREKAELSSKLRSLESSWADSSRIQQMTKALRAKEWETKPIEARLRRIEQEGRDNFYDDSPQFGRN
ncbi:hypothetical protein D9611_011419 [Ephemerocybe angulata]|uniref:G domain-containing protein n=1 Tax=Ephemerocybe angulata TaxID=980116 RepID=A0A8H5FJM4_9AGAR|nr:hypothetical protein D9611_011419 [Tulosesus angulatus]